MKQGKISHNIFSKNPLSKPVCACTTFKVNRNNFTSSNSLMSNAKSKVVLENYSRVE